LQEATTRQLAKHCKEQQQDTNKIINVMEFLTKNGNVEETKQRIK